MSYYVVKRPKTGRVALAVFGVLVLGLVALVAGAWMLVQRPFQVNVDGARVVVAPAATIEDLVVAKSVWAEPGDLIAVDGSIAATGAGLSPLVTRNGRFARASQRLYPGDVVVSTKGADVRESLVTSRVPIPFKTKTVGNGSITEIEKPGMDGIKLVAMGEISGIEVSSTVVKEPQDMVVRRTHPSKGAKLVALTFDDGPWPTATDKIRRILKEEGVNATFFVLGARVRKDPGTVKALVADGNQVASHTYSHKELDSLGPKAISKEIVQARSTIKRACGVETRWVRPPYGAMDSQAWRQFKVTGTRGVLWDVDSRDWTRPGSKKIVKNVVSHTRPGAVVLMHDGGGERSQTVRAIRPIIRQLKKKGYTFVTIDELAAVRGARLDRHMPPVKAKPAANKR